MVRLGRILGVCEVKGQALRGNAFVAKFRSCGVAFFRIAGPENYNDTLFAKLARGLQAETAIAASNECNLPIWFCVTHFASFIFCFAQLDQKFKTPSCCINEKRFPTPQWSVILPSRTRITSTVSK